MKIVIQSFNKTLNEFFNNFFNDFSKVKFIFVLCCISLLQFLIPFAAHANTSKLCRNYFVHADLLQIFSPDEKNGFFQLAEKYSEVMEHPHDSVSDVKDLLDKELKKILKDKGLNKTQLQDLQSLFLNLVREFRDSKSDKNSIQAQEIVQAQRHLLQQTQLHRRQMKYYNLLKSYNVENFEDLLAAILNHYQTRDVFEALLRSNGKLKLGDRHIPDLLEIEFLLELQTNKNQVDKDRNNVLVYAARYGAQQSVQLLINSGVDINNSNDASRSPLWATIISGNPNTAQTLIRAGANLELVDSNKSTALMFAAFVATPASRIILSQLIQAGANRDQQDNQGDTALMHAVEKNDYSVVDLLLASGVNINLHNESGETALLKAIHLNNSSEIVDVLLKFGADPNLLNTDGYTPLAMAAIHNAVDAIPLLLAAGARINEKDSEGKTALMYAAYNASRDAVQALLNANADVTLKNNEDETAIGFARSANFAKRTKMNSSRVETDITFWKLDKKETIQLLKARMPKKPSTLRSLWDSIVKKVGG